MVQSPETTNSRYILTFQVIETNTRLQSSIIKGLIIGKSENQNMIMDAEEWQDLRSTWNSMQELNHQARNK